MDSQRASSLRRWSVVVLTVVVVGIAAWVLRSPSGRNGGASVEMVKSTASNTEIATSSYTLPSFTMVDAQIAISESLRRLPAEHLAQATPVARLLPFSQVDAWRHASSPGANPTDPAWLVGIAGDGLTVDEVMNPNVPHRDAPSSGATPVVVAGAFFVWYARTGDIAGAGILQLTGQNSLTSIIDLPSLPMTVEPASPLPPYPTDVIVTPGGPTAEPWW